MSLNLRGALVPRNWLRRAAADETPAVTGGWEDNAAVRPSQTGGNHFVQFDQNAFIPKWMQARTTTARRLAEGLPRIRGVSRGLFLNSTTMPAFVRAVVNNTIKPRAPYPTWGDDEVDEETQKAVQSVWQRFLDSTCSANMSGHDMLEATLRDTIVDGDILIYPSVRPASVRERSRLWFQFIPADQFFEDYALTEETFYAGLPRQRPPAMRDRRIQNGVETDTRGEPVAFWLRDTPTAGSATRFSASQFIHLYSPQTALNLQRGVPWNFAAQHKMIELERYDNAEMTKLVVGAEFFLTLVRSEASGRPENIGDVLSGMAELESGKRKEKTLKLQPRRIAELPAGSKIEAPRIGVTEQSNLNYRLALMRDVAAALGLSMQAIYGDWAAANFASSRQASKSDQRTYRSIRNWYEDALLLKVYKRVVEVAIGNGDIRITSAAHLDAVLGARMMFSEWASTEPHREAPALLKLVDAGIMSREELLALLYDKRWRHQAEQLSQEDRIMERLGITPQPTTPPPAPAAPMGDAGAEEETESPRPRGRGQGRGGRAA